MFTGAGGPDISAPSMPSIDISESSFPTWSIDFANGMLPSSSLGLISWFTPLFTNSEAFAPRFREWEIRFCPASGDGTLFLLALPRKGISDSFACVACVPSSKTSSS
jgi:hypothetical protein